MNIRTFAALPLIAALLASPAVAGTLGTTVTEPEIIPPVVPIPGALGAGTVAAAVIGAATIIAVVGGGDDDTTTTTTTTTAVE